MTGNKISLLEGKPRFYEKENTLLIILFTVKENERSEPLTFSTFKIHLWTYTYRVGVRDETQTHIQVDQFLLDF